MSTYTNTDPRALADEQLRRLEEGGLVQPRLGRRSSLEIVAQAVRDAAEKLPHRRAA